MAFFLSGTTVPVTIRVSKRNECQPIKDRCGYQHCFHNAVSPFAGTVVPANGLLHTATALSNRKGSDTG